MRPRRLVLEGFASYRERVEIDFVDADLFALSGPTGAGKSSVIDAMTFALYGTVPRYMNKGLVWPVISQGLNEARVQLDFSAGNQQYSAVRVVRRTGERAAQHRAATLEDASGRTLAGNPDELTESVTRIIGLPFEHFTRCVVLPQGDFAAFLHAKSGERQELLVQLLGLDIYKRIAQSANQRAAEAAMQVAVMDRQLEQLAGVTEEAIEEAGARVEALAALVAKIDAAKPALDEAAAERERAVKAVAEAQARARTLENVRLPAGIDRLASTIAAAAAELTSATAALETAVDAREEAERAVEQAGSRGRLEALLDAHRRHATLERERGEAERALAKEKTAVETANGVLEKAEEAHHVADEALQHLARDHAAAHLAEHLVAGQPCPVCLQKVKSLPDRARAPDLEKAKAARQRTEAARNDARGKAHAAANRMAARQATLDALIAQLQSVLAQLADQPGPEDAAQRLVQVGGAERALQEARNAETELRKRHASALQAADDASALEKRAQGELHQRVVSLAALALAPPTLDDLDLRAAWLALTRWSEEQLRVERAVERTERAAEASAVERWKDVQRELVSACTANGIRAKEEGMRDAAATAHAQARADADRLARDLELRARLTEDRQRIGGEAAVARELSKLLNANHFERWLMNHALRLLVDGATRTLQGLSSGAYSLALDDRNEFLVIDHRNADDKRMARTLSGGETFLASLALALALADHVASLASGGAARIEALFLDEGFGTLDAVTLDTVATALEELGSRGRMVGLVTHVRELAERMPARFEVRKVGGVSAVQKVSA